MQKTLGIVVEEIRLRIHDGQVDVFAITDGVERHLWSQSVEENFEEKIGAIAIKFSPLAQKG